MSNPKNLASTLESLSLKLTGVAGHAKIHACVLSLADDYSEENLNKLSELLDGVYSTGTEGRTITLNTMKSLVNQEVIEDETVEDETVEDETVEPSETDVVFEDAKK